MLSIAIPPASGVRLSWLALTAPHEAAVDIGLLELARTLRDLGEQSWRRYFEAAERNINGYQLGALWNGLGFQEQPWDTTLVSNKNATTMEALLLYEELSGHDMEVYINGAVDVILHAQEREGSRAGATVHAGTGAHRLAIGIYTARSMCALLSLHERYPRPELLQAVAAAINYLNGLIASDGTYFGRYSDGQLIANPRWLAPSGDLLRLALLAEPHGLTPSGMIDELVHILLGSQLPSGGMQTAYGFGTRGTTSEYDGLPEFRDVLPVVGWCDKAFRALAMLMTQETVPPPADDLQEAVLDCTWKGRKCRRA